MTPLLVKQEHSHYQAVQSQNFGKNQNQNHANEQLWLMGCSSYASVTNNADSKTSCQSRRCFVAMTTRPLTDTKCSLLSHPSLQLWELQPPVHKLQQLQPWPRVWSPSLWAQVSEYSLQQCLFLLLQFHKQLLTLRREKWKKLKSRRVNFVKFLINTNLPQKIVEASAPSSQRTARILGLQSQSEQC